MAQSPETHTDPQAQPRPGSAQTSAAPGAAARAAGGAAERTAEGERRTFADGADASRHAAQTGADAARHIGAKGADTARESLTTGAHAVRDIAAHAADTSRRLTETGRQTTHEVADLWRSSLEPLPGLQLEMTRLFDDFWRGAFSMSGLPTLRASRPFAGLGAAALFGQPPVDVKETERAYVIAIEAPGLNADDLDIAIEGDALAVRGHKAEEREDATATYRVSERRFGRFERRFPLTPDVERHNIEAQYRDGVLKLTLPKTQDGEHHRAKIEVRREGGAQDRHAAQGQQAAR